MKSKIAKFMCVAVVMVAAFMVSAAANAQEGAMGCQLGLGYQGIMAGELINGASLRMLPAPLGAQLVVGYWEGDIDDVDVEADLYTIRGKVLYSLVNKELVKFYVGAELGYTEADVEGADADAWTYGPLFGAEWMFEEIPEIGFNFEVGYQFNDVDVEDTDIDLDGVNVTFGIHYYF